MKIAAIIPARAGSKRCANKNIRPFYRGESLLWWTMKQAKASGLFHTIIVTTDISVIRAPYNEYTFVHRPHFLANDTATTDDVVLHALWSLSDLPDAFFVLQVTSPFRTLDDYAGVANCLKKEFGVISYSESRDRNGAFYAWRTDYFLSMRNLKSKNSVRFFMEHTDPLYIDEEEDFLKAQRLILTEKWSREYDSYP